MRDLICETRHDIDRHMVALCGTGPVAAGVQYHMATGGGRVRARLGLEAGEILNLGDPVPDGRIRMGLGGGAARPSTGYAFARIQRQADLVTRALVQGDPVPASLDGPFARFMDRVFLQVIQTMPERGPALFESLFRNASRDRLEHFLSGPVHPVDRLAVMTSLPTLPFLRAAMFPV
ncbi:MAG: lycopene cyclase family protein [Roseovarius sp.]|nr:lycopene cyclase family protein [Roseovarius sp.]